LETVPVQSIRATDRILWHHLQINDCTSLLDLLPKQDRQLGLRNNITLTMYHIDMLSF
jgi:hypothetical protein